MAKLHASSNLDEISEKKIWFFHHYATPPSLSGFVRPYEFSKRLNQMGNETTVFTSSYLHFSSEQLINDKKKFLEVLEDGVRFIFVKTISGSNGLKRVANMYSYYRNVYKQSQNIIKDEGVPDYIIASSPHPLSFLAGYRLSRRYGIKFITEVRDLWPEVFFVNNIFSKKSIIGRMMLRFEKFMYENSDAIIFLKEGDYNYLIENKWTLDTGGTIDLGKVYYINNGVDLKKFYENIQKYQYFDKDLASDKFKITYTGSIRKINNIQFIVDAAKKLRDFDNIIFLIFGEGNEEEALKNEVRKYGLTNIKFKGKVAKKYIPSILSQSSVNILNYSQSKYNWGRGNSSNKLFEYLASGRPVISTVKMGYCPLTAYNCGYSTNNDIDEFIQIIQNIENMSLENYALLCDNSTKAAVDFDYKVLTTRLINILKKVDNKDYVK